MKAYAWRSGRIDFGRKTPEGALTIASGPAKKIKRVISAVSRHAYDGETLLVPGIPEAANEDEAWDALIAFQARIALRMSNEDEARDAVIAFRARAALRITKETR